MEQTISVDASAENSAACFHFSGQRFPGEGCRIQQGTSFYYGTVQRDFLPGFYDNHVTDCHLFRRNFLQTAVSCQHMSKIRSNIHKRRNGAAGTTNSVVLKGFPHLIKEHNENGFTHFTNDHSTYSRKGHQKVFIENLPFENILHCLQNDIIAKDCVRNQKQRCLPLFLPKTSCHKKRQTHTKAENQLFACGFFFGMRMTAAIPVTMSMGNAASLSLFCQRHFYVFFVLVYDFCYSIKQLCLVCFCCRHQTHFLFQQIDFCFFCFRHFSHGFFDFSSTIGTGQAFQGNGHFSLRLLLFHKGYFHVTFVFVYGFCYFFQQFCLICFRRGHQSHFLLQQIDFRFFCFRHFSHGFFDFSRAVGTGQAFQGNGHFFHDSHL